MNVYFSLILFRHLCICGRFYIDSIITHIVAYSDLYTDQECQKWELYFRLYIFTPLSRDHISKYVKRTKLN